MLTMSGPSQHSLRIVRYPDLILRATCERIERIDDSHRALAAGMFQIMYASHGVGLAAPQVGRRIRLFVANPTAQPGQHERVYINPEIVYQDGAEVGDEGCLSVPGVSCRIKRHTHVRLRAQDLEGKIFETTGEGLLAPGRRLRQYPRWRHRGQTKVVNVPAPGEGAVRGQDRWQRKHPWPQVDTDTVGS